MPTDPANNYTEIPVKRGGGPYDEYVNNAMDIIAKNRVVSGTSANRPNAGQNFAPQRYYEHDNNIEYYNQGSSWRAIGSDPSPYQMAKDGAVVPVAPGVGYLDAIEMSTTNTPVQDAVDAIEAVKFHAVNGHYTTAATGTVLLPPGVVETPGGIAGLGNKSIIGWGDRTSVIRNTSTDTSTFAMGGEGTNMRFCRMDGFALDGGDRANRTAGSAISGIETSNNSLTESATDLGFNIGTLTFYDWGGPDPVIQGGVGYSNQFGYLRGMLYDGSFYEGGGFHTDLGYLALHHSSFDTPVIDLQEPFGAVYIRTLNVGGNVGRGLRYASGYTAFMGLYTGHINIEPDSSGGGTLTSAPAPVELYGPAPVDIQAISVQNDRLTADYAVAFGDNTEEYPNSSNVGAGNNNIGPILYSVGSTSNVGVLGNDTVRNPSWYYGSASDITYNGHPNSTVIPMYDLDFTPS